MKVKCKDCHFVAQKMMNIGNDGKSSMSLFPIEKIEELIDKKYKRPEASANVFIGCYEGKFCKESYDWMKDSKDLTQKRKCFYFYPKVAGQKDFQVVQKFRNDEKESKTLRITLWVAVGASILATATSLIIWLLEKSC